MSELVFFDAFCQIGPRPRKHTAQPWSLPELVSELEHCSISGALVSSTLSITYDFMHSNLELSTALESHPALYPVWNVVPHQFGECPRPSELLKLARKQKVGAISLAPKTNAWGLLDETSRELLSHLEKSAVLGIISREELSDWNELDRLLETFPQWPLLLTAVH